MKKMNMEEAIEQVESQRIENANKPYVKLHKGSVKKFVEADLNKNELLVYFLLKESLDKDSDIVLKTSGKLSELSGIPKQSIDNTLTRLEKKGFIYRETSYNQNGYRTRKIVVL